MKRFTPVDEPAYFDTRCRKRGRAWLKGNPNYRRPKDYWSEFEPDVREAFSKLCGYCVMLTMKGQVDHFVPVAILKKRKKDRDAYEWSNFRYGDRLIGVQRPRARSATDNDEPLPSCHMRIAGTVTFFHRT